MRAAPAVPATMWTRWIAVALVVSVVAAWLARPAEVKALPAGFQEFYLPLPADLARSTFRDIDNDPSVGNTMHYVVGVTASADNTILYYDHWENGLSTGATGDEI